jgi:predicted GTPase
MGAAGRDFHNFNTYLRNNLDYHVVAFTAEQIPGIADKTYPKVLSGKLYPKGIPILPESDLPELIKKHKIDQVILSYSDLSYQTVMEKAALVLSSGADFRLLGPNNTFIESKKPVIAICAVRTGAGKSPTTRAVTKYLRSKGKSVVVIRHPMPYGDLAKQVCQRFAVFADLDKHETTIEEREEYQAESEADIIIWDGGNNDLPFYKPDLHIVIADPLRPGHEVSYYPGGTNLRMADIVIINKISTAKKKDIELVTRNIKNVNPKARILRADLNVTVEDPKSVKNKNVLIVEDGPTITHGEMSSGAGYIAAKKYRARTITDPRPYLTGSLRKTFEKFPHIGKLLPAMGYGAKQIKELQNTINNSPADVILSGTPIDLTRLITIKPEKTIVRVKYEYKDLGKTKLESYLENFL